MSFGSDSVALLSGRASLNGSRLASCSGTVAVKLSRLHELLSNVTEPSWVGQGAQGVVLKGHWRSGCCVAVKWLVGSASELPAACLEALLARLAAHPCLVQTFEAAVARLEEGWDCLSACMAQAPPPPRPQPQQCWVESVPQGGQGEIQSLDPACGGGQSVAFAAAAAPAAGAPAAVSAAEHARCECVPGGSGNASCQDGPAAVGGVRGGAASLNSSVGSSQLGRPSGIAVSPTAPLTPPGHEVPSPFVTPSGGAAPATATATGATAADLDSFDGHPAAAALRPVELVGVLRQLGAAPGKYVVQIVSEWCDEGTLHAAIRRGVFRQAPGRSRAWALRALLRTAREVALGMCHLHSLGVIHGDLKPGNVLLKSSRADSRGFTAKVADLGLSRLLCGPQEQFVTTSEWGTVPYMAGEYLDNRLCRSSDVYSFGVLLWQMYTGKAPFADHLEAQVAVGVMLGTLALEWPPGMPSPLLRLGQACCRHEPEQRPTFKEVAVALAGIELQVREASVRAKQAQSRAIASSGTAGPASAAGPASGLAAASCGPGADALRRGLTHGPLLLGSFTQPPPPPQVGSVTSAGVGHVLRRTSTQTPCTEWPQTCGRYEQEPREACGQASPSLSASPAAAYRPGSSLADRLVDGRGGGVAAMVSAGAAPQRVSPPVPISAPSLQRRSVSLRGAASLSRLHVSASCADAPTPDCRAFAAAATGVPPLSPPALAFALEHAYVAAAGQVSGASQPGDGSGLQSIDAQQCNCEGNVPRRRGGPHPLAGLTGPAVAQNARAAEHESALALGVVHSAGAATSGAWGSLFESARGDGGPEGPLTCSAVQPECCPLSRPCLDAKLPLPLPDVPSPAVAVRALELSQFSCTHSTVQRPTPVASPSPQRASSLPITGLQALLSTGDGAGAAAEDRLVSLTTTQAASVAVLPPRGASLPAQLACGDHVSASAPVPPQMFAGFSTPACTPLQPRRYTAEGFLSLAPVQFPYGGVPAASGGGSAAPLRGPEQQRAASHTGLTAGIGGAASFAAPASRVDGRHSSGEGAVAANYMHPASPVAALPAFADSSLHAAYLVQRSIAGSALAVSPGPSPTASRRQRSRRLPVAAHVSNFAGGSAAAHPAGNGSRHNGGGSMLPAAAAPATRGGRGFGYGGAGLSLQEDAAARFSSVVSGPLAPLQEAAEGPCSNHNEEYLF